MHRNVRAQLVASRWAARVAAGLLSALLLAQALPAAAVEVLEIGSKRFTESYILGELLLQAAARLGPAEHKAGLGNTGILYAALRAGSIDVYPEYSGTIAREILKLEGNPGLVELNRALAPSGLAASIPLGFNNTYALGVREDLATRLGLHSIADLAPHRELRLGLSQEFIARKDGWPGLVHAYGLASFAPIGLDHGLAYEALAGNRVDVIDTYSTDAKIARYHIRLLVDDRGYFPRYDTLLLHRADAPQRFPQQWQALAALEGTIDERSMICMNAAAEAGSSFAQAAALYFQAPAARTPDAPRRGFLEVLFAPDLARLTREHLLLVFGSLAASIAVGVPLGVAAARKRWLAQPIFAFAGMVQTIPSLALLAFLIALMGTIGTLPAAIALFLYALLPIIRNTHTGMLGVGAGGYGERIAAGLAVNDNSMLLAGAVPAAILALLVQGMFDLIDHWADPHRRL